MEITALSTLSKEDMKLIKTKPIAITKTRSGLLTCLASQSDACLECVPLSNIFFKIYSVELTQWRGLISVFYDKPQDLVILNASSEIGGNLY